MSEDEATARLRVEVGADVKKFETALESINQLEARSTLGEGVIENGNGHESDPSDCRMLEGQERAAAAGVEAAFCAFKACETFTTFRYVHGVRNRGTQVCKANCR